MRTILFALLVVASLGQSAHATDYYGAIAMSPSTQALGWTYNFRSRAGAEGSALQRCGDDDCQIAIWFRNACGSYASGDGDGWGAAWGATRRSAIRNALNACAEHTDNCVTQRWVCTQR